MAFSAIERGTCHTPPALFVFSHTAPSSGHWHCLSPVGLSQCLIDLWQCLTGSPRRLRCPVKSHDLSSLAHLNENESAREAPAVVLSLAHRSSKRTCSCFSKPQPPEMLSLHFSVAACCEPVWNRRSNRCLTSSINFMVAMADPANFGRLRMQSSMTTTTSRQCAPPVWPLLDDAVSRTFCTWGSHKQ